MNTGLKRERQHESLFRVDDRCCRRDRFPMLQYLVDSGCRFQFLWPRSMQGSVMTWSKEVNDYVIPTGFAFALAVVYVIYLLCYPSQQNRDTITAFLVSARRVYVGCQFTIFGPNLCSAASFGSTQRPSSSTRNGQVGALNRIAPWAAYGTRGGSSFHRIR